MPDEQPITDITYANQLKQIQAQLAVLETSYANMTRTYYDMFYNKTPMDITLEIYKEDGVLEKITVPNRAKASTSAMTHSGSPSGVTSAALGTLLLDTTTGDLWYESLAYDVDGWVRIANHNALTDEYLKKNGNGELLTDLSADHMTQGQLEVAVGGTGVSSSTAINMSGILKMVPQTTDASGKITRAHIAVAEVGKDYLDSANLAGMIVFFPMFNVPAGYIICNGSACDRFNEDGTDKYETLYNVLTNYGTNIPDWAIYYNEDGTIDTNKFRVPDLGDYFIRCTTNELERTAVTLQADGIPNFKGTWSMELPGGTANNENITGAISIVLDDEGNYKQVDGKSSAPSGSYDYLFQINPQSYNDICAQVYQDGLNEVRVKNISLVPAIKY
jgi:hypothetical protein